MTTTHPAPALTPQQAGDRARQVLDEVGRAVVGKPEALELVMLGVLAGGHVLIEDLPGLGKTLLARSFATALGLDFQRIQFTPDLLPSDVAGAPFYDQRTGEMVFRPGPVFTHLLLADEINRTPPKTQAALLEAMAEAQVSVDGVTRRLPEPFVVIATANPIEYEGTYSLPEAQLDRFLLRVRMGYLPVPQEAAMLRARIARAAPEAALARLTDPVEVVAMRSALERVEVDDALVDYVVALVDATRSHPQIQVGASPRGGLALLQLARARAVLAGRDYLVPEDVKALAVPALAHRVTLRPELWVRQINADEVIAALVDTVPAPATAPGSPAAAPATAPAATAAAARS
ncbi:ATPase [Kitasatospora sp. MMS16-BH015]|uniref:AAA family ATPase n=1 Tax=Kitasatospora sp. MMS16-BH015 TaxID=2018025 RepID=UPI000CA11A4A|nr:MoxR family ATPase [Kitasatospora sp. MMS16-BH015]AUG82074.1 ATPase [Kitasatospora sp. MMS16-BH015]